MDRPKLIYGGIILIVLAIFFSTENVTLAAGPLETIKGPIEEMIGVLKDPVYKDPAKKDEQRQKLWKLAKNFFDFKQMAKLTLATHRKEFSPEQLNEFTDVFADFLAGIYINRIQGEYHDETVTFLDEQMLSDTKAMVHTEVNQDTTKVPVSYRLYKKDDHWMTYDLIIERVSLVQNYRTQFNQILVKDSPQDLINQLKTKIEENKTQKTADK